MNTQPNTLLVLCALLAPLCAVLGYGLAWRVRRYRMAPHLCHFSYGTATARVCREGVPSHEAFVLCEADGILFTTDGRFRRHGERAVWVCVRDPRRTALFCLEEARRHAAGLSRA